jgi:hypothetical protein
MGDEDKPPTITGQQGWLSMTATATKPTTATAIEDGDGYQRRLLTMAINNGYRQQLSATAIELPGVGRSQHTKILPK